MFSKLALLQFLPPFSSFFVCFFLSVWFWALGRAGWGRPSSWPCSALRWWCWRRGRRSPGTTSSTCGPTPSVISAALEPRSSTESSALDLWITSVSLLMLFDFLTCAWWPHESLWMSHCSVNVSKFIKSLSPSWPVFLAWLLFFFILCDHLFCVDLLHNNLKVFSIEKTGALHEKKTQHE